MPYERRPERAKPEEQRDGLRRPPFTLANSDASQWAGRTTLNSGSATVTVSTDAVNSDSLILLGPEAPGTNVASGFAKPIEVKSKNPGAAFVLGTTDGVAMARDTTVAWLVYRTS